MPDFLDAKTLFESLMLICFGIGWPISILKALKTKMVSGKSPLFMGIVFFGYICGITHKLTNDSDNVIYLYVLNAVMVAFDFFLYYYYLNKKELATLPSE